MDDNTPPEARPILTDLAEPHSFTPEAAFPPPVPAPKPASPFDLHSILFAIFKHKWKILTCSLAGFIGAAVVYLADESLYLSEAKLLIKHSGDEKMPSIISDDTESKGLRVMSDAVTATEIEILRTTDIADQVVSKVGPERILNDPALAQSRQAALITVRRNLQVTVPGKGVPMMNVSYAHPNPKVAQMIVQAAIEAYLKRQQEIHRAPSQFADAMEREAAALKASLTQSEQELRRLKSEAGTDSVADQKKVLAALINKLEQDKMATEAQIAEKRAILDYHAGEQPTPSETNVAPAATPPPEKVDQYQRTNFLLSSLAKRERDYLFTYTPDSLVVQGVRSQIEANSRIISQLEAEYPALRGTAANTTGSDFNGSADEGSIRALQARIKILDEQIAEKQAEVQRLSGFELQIADLERSTRQKDERYRLYVTSRDQRETENKITEGTNTNIQVVQEASVAGHIPGRNAKIAAGLLFGGIALGFGLAAALEFYVDQSVRRPIEIENSLGLPLFFSIPYLPGSPKQDRRAIGAAPKDPHHPSALPPLNGGSASIPSQSALSIPAHGLRGFFDALRDRLVFYFEIRNFTRKPKLIAVTGCGERNGVSTIASGIAASLSEAGDENVLLVNMNPGSESPFQFHKGELKCGLDDVLQREKRDSAMVSDNLYVVSQATGEERINAILPRRFTKLVPKLKASDYDYIIFDLPPVNQISATPQLARYMDMVLMVVESEKTGREMTQRVGTMFAEAGVNYGVVLNKTRDYVPRALRNLLATNS